MNFVFWAPEAIIDNGGDPTMMTHEEQEAFVRGLANDVIDGATDLKVTVDGVSLQNLSDYRVESPPGGFVLDVPQGSLLTEFGLDAGDRDSSATDGYWIMLAPLSEGDHEIHFSAAIPDIEVAVDVAYDLHVVGGNSAFAVPEPSAAALAVFAFCGLLGFARKPSNRKAPLAG